MAHAQSRHRFPWEMAWCTFPSGSSVVPTQNIYESTSLVTCIARACNELSEDETYRVSTLMREPSVEIFDMTVA